MNISVTKAAKEWGVSRTTIYQKVNDGELSRAADKKIDTAEMLRVFGEPLSKKRTEHRRREIAIGLPASNPTASRLKPHQQNLSGLAQRTSRH